ncbi:hypothetical protein Hore_23000 [Halothermothrix orenii H 168]|uniref:Uncharacterized protein n=1 Tax=Halothermothrix orenii (strain H 168 / OCM 544 / DSM 9562) TaxID=373903 RepID=B8D193_HALOH|nr:hypothetical protein Hore_23000 [Halothermothrix orenii H 168]
MAWSGRLKEFEIKGSYFAALSNWFIVIDDNS